MIFCLRKSVSLTSFVFLMVVGVPMASSQAYDDPAFAICEFSRFGWDGPQKRGMERVEARIDGQSVFLTYEQSILGLKPRTRKLSCTYAYGDNGFELRVRRPEQAEACDIALGALSKAGLDIDQRIKLEQAAAECRAVLESEKQENHRLQQKLGDLISEGVYPIRQNETGLIRPK